MDCLDEDKWTCTEPDEDEVHLIVHSHGPERKAYANDNQFVFIQAFICFWRASSDFLAQLGLKAGSAAQLLEASGLSNSKPEPVFQASEGLGLSRPANPGFPA